VTRVATEAHIVTVLVDAAVAGVKSIVDRSSVGDGRVEANRARGVAGVAV